MSAPPPISETTPNPPTTSAPERAAHVERPGVLVVLAATAFGLMAAAVIAIKTGPATW